MEKQEEKKVFCPEGQNPTEETQKELLIKDYEPPRTKKTGVETESGFCASEPVTDNVTTDTSDPVEVDEYISIGGEDGKIDISFD